MRNCYGNKFVVDKEARVNILALMITFTSRTFKVLLSFIYFSKHNYLILVFGKQPVKCIRLIPLEQKYQTF